MLRTRSYWRGREPCRLLCQQERLSAAEKLGVTCRICGGSVKNTFALVVGSMVLSLATGRAEPPAHAAPSWKPAAATAYLDARAEWWVKWPKAQRDHETTCISCHTALPYLLSRDNVSGAPRGSESPSPEQIMLRNLR